ncbi:hypothetical protein J6590_103843 [Homalodisca vitripennis]|nr:hypothetical protein J6590_103843 [Homalodisca vitripennis]
MPYWKKSSFSSSALCKSLKSRPSKRREKETAWWNERIAEAVKNKNRAWREWFKDSSNEKRDKWKRLARASAKMMKEAKERTWKGFEEKLKSNFQGNKKIFYGEIKWEEKEVLKTWKEYFKELLEGTENEEERRDMTEETEDE